MKNVQTLRGTTGLAAIVALIGLVAASCDNATTTNNDTPVGCGYALCACSPCAGANCDCDEQQAQAITVQIAEGVTMTMNWIAPGTFTQGQAAVAPNAGQTEREVTLTSGFFMGIHSVTQEQFYAVMGANPSDFSSNPAEGEVQGRRPVETVNWYHAIAFANRLSIMLELDPVYYVSGINWETLTFADVPTTNNATWNAVTANWEASGFRLPTEAEWEFSARAGTNTQWSFGDTDADIDYYAWTSLNSNGMTREVGLLRPNAWGLYDMHGNVWDWVWDWNEARTTDPATDPRGPAAGGFRVIRGGCWGLTPDDARSAIRVSSNPGFRFEFLGFRVVRP